MSTSRLPPHSSLTISHRQATRILVPIAANPTASQGSDSTASSTSSPQLQTPPDLPVDGPAPLAATYVPYNLPFNHPLTLWQQRVVGAIARQSTKQASSLNDPAVCHPLLV